MELGVRVAYPEQGNYDWYEALKPYPAVEVAFRDPTWFISADLEEQVCWSWLQGLDLPRVLSIHLPHVRITDMDTLWFVLDAGLHLAQQLRAWRLVIHPTNASREGGLRRLREILRHFAPAMATTGTSLCWETFLGKRRFVNTIESIYWSDLFACYDTSHMRRDSEGMLSDLGAYKDTIKVVHLSNWDEYGQHLPLRQGVLDMRTILVYLGKYFDGPVILEYLPKYHHLYLDDIRWAWKKVLK